MLVLCAIWLSVVPGSSSAGEPEPIPESEIEKAIGTFDDKERLHNSTEKAWRLPDLGAFVAYYPATHDLSTGLSIELHDKQHRRGFLNKFKYDLYLSDQRMGLAIGKKIIPVVDITISAVYSRDFDRDENVWGFALSLVDF